MKTRTEIILTVMNVLAWVACIGLLIKAGAILISYGVSTVNPIAAKNLYKGWGLYDVRQFNFWHYTGTVTFMIAILIMEAYTAFLVTRVLSKIKLISPFTVEVSNLLERISYLIVEIWVVALLYNAHVKWLSKRIEEMQGDILSTEFLFLAGVVFIFSKIFKKGVEIQSENELTV